MIQNLGCICKGSGSCPSCGHMAGLTGIGGKTSKTKVTLQDRLIFELLDETGGRRGEIASLRIKDIQFEKIGDTLTAILWLNGKTGVRR